MAKKKTEVYDLPCQFKTLAMQATTLRLGISLASDAVDAGDACKIFVGKRLNGFLILGRKSDGSGQQTIEGTDIKEKGTFDCKGVTVNVAHITSGLIFPGNDDDLLLRLRKFSNKSGRLKIIAVGELPDDVSPHDEGLEADAAESEAEETKPKRRKRETASV